MNRFRFIKVRDVKTPSRSNACDAGLDFYIPRNLTPDQIMGIEANQRPQYPGHFPHDFILKADNSMFITDIEIYPGGRILIPSGIKPLIEPRDSMFMAANKSGLASKKGLLYTAEIVDSPYTGEIHMGIINVGKVIQTLRVDEKATQFIHVPVYLTEPEEIKEELYQYITEREINHWSQGTRGDKGFGSSGD